MIIYSIFIDPLNYVATLRDSDAKIVWEKDTDGVIFRQRLDGKFSLTRAGNEFLFDKLIALTYCEKGLLTCTDSFGTVQGRFHKKNLLISEDKCYIEIKFDREDEYTCLDGIMDKEVNILQYNTNYPISAVTAKLLYGKTYQYYDCVGVRTFNGSFFDATYGWLNIDDGRGNYETVDCVGTGGLWKPYQTSYSLVNNDDYVPYGSNVFNITTTWVRETKQVQRLGSEQSEDIPGYDYDHFEIIGDNGYDYFVKTPVVSRMVEPDPILTFNVPFIVTATHATEYSTDILDRCRRLNDVISLLIATCFDSWESEFFKSKTNPMSGADLSNLLITQKSDAIDPATSDPATKGMLTFKTLMDYLKRMFEVYWAIDSHGKFRIEHKKYWDNNESYTVNNTVGIDLTTEYPQSLIATNEYRFEEQIPIREEFKFMEAWHIDFIGADIDYSQCIETGDVITNSVDIFTTDVDPVLLTAYASKEGFCILHCDSDADEDNRYIVFQETGLLSELLIANAHLSWANLHVNYWKYGRYLPNGLMNFSNTDFEVRPLKYQKSITFPYCFGEFNPNYLIKTYLGNGIVKTASFSFKTRWITVELEYIDNI